jgi:ankyrin repeat protein
MKPTMMACVLLVQTILLPASYQGPSQETTVIEAVLSNDAGRLRSLLESGADSNQTGENKNTALMLAVALGNPELTMTLIEAGADVNRRNVAGVTALIFAALDPKSDPPDMQEKDLSTLHFLLDKGADVNAKSNDGRTTLMRAAASGNRGAVSLLLEHGATHQRSRQKA